MLRSRWGEFMKKVTKECKGCVYLIAKHCYHAGECIDYSKYKNQKGDKKDERKSN